MAKASAMSTEGRPTVNHDKHIRRISRCHMHSSKKKCRFNLPSCPGCPDHAEGPEDVETARRRHHFINALVTARYPYTSIPSPELHRNQLVLQFADSFFPFNGSGQEMEISKLLVWMSPQSRTMATALDALLLSHQGLTAADPRLSAEGYQRFGTAIRLINNDIQKPTAAYDNGLLGAINILMINALRGLDRTEGSDWQAHVRGMSALMAKRGPSSIQSPLEVALLQNVRHASLAQGLADRKAILYGDEPWLEVASTSFNGDFNELARHAMCVPSLLSRADALLVGRIPDEADVVELLLALARFEDSWLALGLRFCQAETATEVRSVASMYPDLAVYLDPEDRRLSNILVFSSCASVFRHIYYWTCLLLVREAILDVSRLLPYPLLFGKAQESKLTANVDDCAEQLRQAVPYLLHNYDLRSGFQMRCGGLRFVMNWYQRSGNKVKLGWCEAMERASNQNKVTSATTEQRTFSSHFLAGSMLMA